MILTSLGPILWQIVGETDLGYKLVLCHGRIFRLAFLHKLGHYRLKVSWSAAARRRAFRPLLALAFAPPLPTIRHVHRKAANPPG